MVVLNLGVTIVSYEKAWVVIVGYSYGGISDILGKLVP